MWTTPCKVLSFNLLVSLIPHFNLTSIFKSYKWKPEVKCRKLPHLSSAPILIWVEQTMRSRICFYIIKQVSISGGKSGLPPSGDVKNVTSNVLPEAPVDETTFRDKHHNQRKSKFTIFKSVKTLQNHWFVFTFCAFLPYKVGPPVSSVVMSYLQVRCQSQQSSEMNTIDLVCSF